MASEKPVGRAIDLRLLHDVGIVEVGETYRDSEIEQRAYACPVARADGHAIGIVLVEVLDILIIFLHIGAQFLLVGLVHVGHGVERCLQVGGYIAVQVFPYLFLEHFEIVLLLRGNVKLEIGRSHATHPPSGTGPTLFRGLLTLQLFSLCHQALGLRQGSCREAVIITFQRIGRRGEHGGGTHVEPRITSGESPHIIRRTAALAVRRHLIGFQRGIIVQAIRDGSRVTQVMIVVEHGVGERRSHVAYLLCLRHKVEHAMLYVLQDVGRAVWTVKVYIPLLLAHESLVTLRLEKPPSPYQVLHHIDIGARLDIEVSRVEETAHVQAGNKLQWLVLRVGRRALIVHIEVITGRSLQITFLERLSMPYAVAFVHEHVVHVDRHPHVGSGIGNLVIDMFINQEVVCLDGVVLYIVDTGGLHFREVKLHIIIFIVCSPGINLSLIGFRHSAILSHTHQGGGGFRRVLLVQLDDAHLRLLWNVAHLAKAYIGFP